MKRQDRGRRGRPRRRVREGVTKAWLGNVSVRYGQRMWERAYIGVVILAQDVEDPAVKVGFDVVEFVNVGVLDPVDNHLATNDNQERRQDFH